MAQCHPVRDPRDPVSPRMTFKRQASGCRQPVRLSHEKNVLALHIRVRVSLRSKNAPAAHRGALPRSRSTSRHPELNRTNRSLASPRCRGQPSLQKAAHGGSALPRDRPKRSCDPKYSWANLVHGGCRSGPCVDSTVSAAHRVLRKDSAQCHHRRPFWLCDCDGRFQTQPRLHLSP